MRQYISTVVPAIHFNNVAKEICYFVQSSDCILQTFQNIDHTVDVFKGRTLNVNFECHLDEQVNSGVFCFCKIIMSEENKKFVCS